MPARQLSNASKVSENSLLVRGILYVYLSVFNYFTPQKISYYKGSNMHYFCLLACFAFQNILKLNQWDNLEATKGHIHEEEAFYQVMGEKKLFLKGEGLFAFCLTVSGT